MWELGRNLGKTRRSKLGKWLDKNGYLQEDLVRESKVNRNTVSKACSDAEYIPGPSVAKKLLKAIRKIDPNKKFDDFWSM
jgi:hypothetical protein